LAFASTLAKEEKNEERIQERKLIVHKIAVDLETVKNVVEKGKTGFFAKLGFLKPKHEEIECESVLLFTLLSHRVLPLGLSGYCY